MAHVIGLTGGIASGKSSVARLLRARGAAIVDADQLARKVVEPGQPALAELIARFGSSILTAEGTLDRKRLGAIAFADPVARADLGRITHPRIAAASAQAIAELADAGAEVVFYEAALLVENRAHAGLSALLVVSAPEDVQIARVCARDQLSPEDARARIASQLPLADKIAVATWVIDNAGSEGELARELELVCAEIEARFGKIAIPASRRGATPGADGPGLARGRARHRVPGVHRAPDDREARRRRARRPRCSSWRASGSPPRRRSSSPAPAPRCSSATSATWTSGCRAPSTAR